MNALESPSFNLVELQSGICLDLGRDLRQAMLAKQGRGVWLTGNHRLRGEDFDHSLHFPFCSTVGLDEPRQVIWLAELTAPKKPDFANSKLRILKNLLDEGNNYNRQDDLLVFNLDIERGQVKGLGDIEQEPKRTLRLRGLGLLSMFPLGGMDLLPTKPVTEPVSTIDELTELRIVLEDALTGIRNPQRR